MPSDGMAIFLFQSPSSAEVVEAAERAELPFDRIVESIQVSVDEAEQTARKRD